MSLAIVPGSFDPMTLGHLELIKTVAKRYDEVVVAVMVNRSKKYMFDMETRVAIAEETVKELSNVRVIADAGMLIDLFDKLQADAVCKGWREREKKRTPLTSKRGFFPLKVSVRVKKEITLTASSRILFRKLFHLHTVACEAMRTGISRRHGNKSYDVDNMDF